jgi:hypothetical protein
LRALLADLSGQEWGAGQQGHHVAPRDVEERERAGEAGRQHELQSAFGLLGLLRLRRLGAVEERHAAKALAIVGEHRNARHHIEHGAEPRQRLPGIGDEVGRRDRVRAVNEDMRQPHAREHMQAVP